MNTEKEMNELFDQKAEERFDIKKKRISMLKNYGENFQENNYITNPAIGRDEQIKQLILILLTPDKSAVLIGKPGVGKTATVEGLAYRIQKNAVPDVLKGYQVIKLNTAALLGVDPVTGESKVQTLIDELKDKTKLILFIDEIHTLMGTKGEALDFANMFKPALDRGDIKVIGATTTEEYERYILRDKAFVRRFQKVEIFEPTREENIQILIGTLPKIEIRTGAKMMYTPYIQRKVMEFITDITSEYKRIYEIGSRYPDVSLTIVQQAFSNALFDNRREVNIIDFKQAIMNSKNIYPDVIKKSMPSFEQIFSEQLDEYNDTIIGHYEKLSED
ncbi:MAG: ATP-dependent Clp protease ATP-binding subunit [Bacilli bacterium]|nr:ATP-dependent Clp protease ATP-binding subunit [Bacilli bacterium]